MTEPDTRRLFAEAGCPLADDRAEALERYLDLLMRWSKRMSLTGFADRAAAAEGLLLDAAYLSPLLAEGLEVVDVGAGAGGLATALAVLRPDLSLTLVEPRGRRAAFLRAVRRQLALARFDVVEARAEGLGPSVADAAYARALAPPEVWLPMGRRLVRPGGSVLCLTAEAVEASAVPAGLVAAEERRYELPRSGRSRVVTGFRLSR